MADAWDPSQYDRFRDERRQPFDDLSALLRPVPGGRVVDLGCGTGELTRRLHASTGAASTLGVDNSPAMLSAARAGAPEGPEGPGNDDVRFLLADIGTWEGSGYDLVFANASLHWVPEHRRLVPRLGMALGPAGQLAFQVPANFDHVAHRVIREIAAEPPFAGELGGQPLADPGSNVLAPEAYASLLDETGFAEQHVRLQVYGHHLRSAADVVEWMKGTALTPFKAALAPTSYEQLVARYRDVLVERLGPRQPFFYPFKRILVWAQKP
jgi:trans-aconitate 2-methyltransferase